MSEQQQQQPTPNIVLVGKKPPTSYVAAILSFLSNGGKVKVRARGRSILTAIDASQICMVVRKSTVIDNVQIGTEVLQGRRVSFIEIQMS